jgi:hypothetical protein
LQKVTGQHLEERGGAAAAETIVDEGSSGS